MLGGLWETMLENGAYAQGIGQPIGPECLWVHDVPETRLLFHPVAPSENLSFGFEARHCLVEKSRPCRCDQDCRQVNSKELPDVELSSRRDDGFAMTLVTDAGARTPMCHTR